MKGQLRCSVTAVTRRRLRHPVLHQLCVLEPPQAAECRTTGEHCSCKTPANKKHNVFCQVTELNRLSKCPGEGGIMWLELRGSIHKGEMKEKGCPLMEESCLPP